MKRRYCRPIYIAFSSLAIILWPQSLQCESVDQSGGPVEAFSRISDDGYLVASKDVWYLEEFDRLDRPVTGTQWKKGVVSEQTSWLYPDDSQQAGMKIVTSASGSVETEYDRAGNVVARTTSDAAGKTTEIVTSSYDKENRLVFSKTVSGGNTTRIEMQYGKTDQRDKVLYKNGQPVIKWSWTDDENWTETIYRDGNAILTVDYVNGERKGFHETER
jgi:YD repeat-containing protein